MKLLMPLTEAEHDDFWGLAGEPGADGCVPWLGTREPGGHATYYHRGRRVRAQRLAYADTVGPLPRSLVVRHQSGSLVCINTDHLRTVTMLSVVMAGDSAAAVNARKTHCKRGHEFTPENTIVPAGRPTQRHCRACKNGWF